MKAIFEGYVNKEKSRLNLTKGNIYELTETESGFLQVEDDDGCKGIFINGKVLVFSEVDERDDELESDYFEITFRVNGKKIEESKFNEMLAKVESLKECGVVSYIDFEVSYEMK